MASLMGGRDEDMHLGKVSYSHGIYRDCKRDRAGVPLEKTAPKIKPWKNVPCAAKESRRIAGRRAKSQGKKWGKEKEKRSGFFFLTKSNRYRKQKRETSESSEQGGEIGKIKSGTSVHRGAANVGKREIRGLCKTSRQRKNLGGGALPVNGERGNLPAAT